MIIVYHASASLLDKLSLVANERELVRLVLTNLSDYQLGTRVKHSELDIAFAASGGPTKWVNVDNMAVAFSPQPERGSVYGDVLVEHGNGYVNLSTPAGFIPLVDVIERDGSLCIKQLS
ncbi:MAG: hypothetical protein Alis3KO_29230 [Aliiglaciecola sp.]|uniref:hypothetical protein n=1 Tax=Aliiglaciecola sp. M165 TaxID=2593649 RepID=UPI0011806BBB|nr:hypothetical protein [Aliiglaciecola sp. M165]TRY33769.1 hypothetical protein FM019_00475 [Aliiglaciecola sp. M165]